MSNLPKRETVRILVLVLFLALLYVLWGTLQFPLWWYGTFYEGGYKSASNLFGGVIYVFRNYHLMILQTIIIIVTILAFSATQAPQRLRSGLGRLWDHGLLGWATLFVGVAIVLGIVISVMTLESRTREERELERQLQQSSAELKRTMANYEKESQEQLPLSVPTSFIYLDKDSTESLFGQYEPELVPAIMQEEVEQSTQISGGIQSVIATDAGQRELNKKVTEYRSTPKNSERKLKDLVRYLNDRNLLPMFRDIEPKSEELNKLDNATKLLSQRYDLNTDPLKLSTVRDRLLQDELRVVENQLRDLRGLTFVEGDWSIEVQANDYFFRRPFVEKISTSPMCEVKLNKTAINPKYKDVIENAKNKTLRLSIFGTVLIGLSRSSKTVSLHPIAIF